MTFHESFWVVAGTAAPVIALATVVSFGEGLARRAEIQHAAEVRRRAEIQHGAEVRRGVERLSLLVRRGERRAMMQAGISWLNFAVQASVLVFALASLGHGEDEAPWMLMGAFEGLGILALAAAALASFLVQQSLAAARPSAAEAESMRAATLIDLAETIRGLQPPTEPR